MYLAIGFVFFVATGAEAAVDLTCLSPENEEHPVRHISKASKPRLMYLMIPWPASNGLECFDPTAVDWDRDAGDVAGSLRGEENDQVRKFLRSRDASHWNLRFRMHVELF